MSSLKRVENRCINTTCGAVRLEDLQGKSMLGPSYFSFSQAITIPKCMFKLKRS